MFDLAKIKAQLIVGGIVLIVIVGLGMGLKHYYDANARAEMAAKLLEQSNERLVKDLDRIMASRAIDEEMITSQQKAITNLSNLNAQQKAATAEDVRRILAKYANVPQTPENIQKRDAEVSTSRIAGLWKTLCASGTKDPQCDELKKEKTNE